MIFMIVLVAMLAVRSWVTDKLEFARCVEFYVGFVRGHTKFEHERKISEV